MTFSLRTLLTTIFIMLALGAGYGELCYRNGWNTHADKMNAEAARKKEKAEDAIKPVEEKAAQVESEGKVIYRTIYRDVVKYVQTPDRTICQFDDGAVQLRQQAIDAANSLSGFDATTVQSK